MRQLPGRTPARETTRRQSPVWSGDQQPWEVPRSSPGEKGDGHPCPGARLAAPIPGRRCTHHIARSSSDSPLETLAQFFTDVSSGGFSTAVVERAGNGTTLMPKEMDGIQAPTPCDRMPCSYCHCVIRGTGSGEPLLRPLLPPCSWEHSELFEEEVERIQDDSRAKEKEGQHWEDCWTCPEPSSRAWAVMPLDLTPNNDS